ncbi:MAG: DeoR/GlpR family DNA-binding transcription regulator [Actinomycetaceae bacterium]|nr:DeoR/GlpR family DNA-binding transcription regulator [Actinomycetaceae bacterium]
MLSEERQRRILSLVKTKNFVDISELVKATDASEATVRRDLHILVAAGKIRRVRGGASDVRSALNPEKDSVPFHTVATISSAAKKAIGRMAASIVEDGDVIGLDAGTTVASMCEFLIDRPVTIVTTSLAVVRALETSQKLEIIVSGGVVRPSYQSLVGYQATHTLEHVRIDKSFVGTSGIAVDGSVLDTTASEVPIKQAFMKSSRRTFLLADADKFPGTGFLKVADIKDFDTLITNKAAKKLEMLNDTEVEVMFA